MRLLAIDTASAQCSAALLVDGATLQRSVRTARDHAQLLLPMIEELLAEAALAPAALDAIAFGRGPGSFTGLRVAASVAQGFALGADLPVLPVSDLRALALQGAWLLTSRFEAARTLPVLRIACCMDARMSEVYAAAFEVTVDGLPGDATERVCPPASFRPPGEHQLLIGAGFGAYADALAPLRAAAWAVEPDAEPHAAAVAALGASDLASGGGLDAAQALPTYLRDNVAQQAP